VESSGAPLFARSNIMALSSTAIDSGQMSANEGMSLKYKRNIGISVMPKKRKLEIFDNLLARSTLSR
jgi:hypothetical protein